MSPFRQSGVNKRTHPHIQGTIAPYRGPLRAAALEPRPMVNKNEALPLLMNLTQCSHCSISAVLMSTCATIAPPDDPHHPPGLETSRRA
jgi:hypothetical protein